ncbi:N-terminal double-transmembrane domain-containing protein [Salegentibacter echinorum]|uniref:N-terminal double-transmembrane domain-containing protein n=1 Tax=Salegentibacter echinorum TaxID=1073325 RepID=A0A1M5M6F6_SALEC|nr:BatA domain-containing protein [Salegentibacter echinorum]SHG72820.1 N-terminal double-transmembrane domain-containing protein [Salegentibacter echinorum]
MEFKQPELLYALFLLIIPLAVHLFQLRRFEKEDFTNVKFLQKVIKQTRKSSRLKKWLVLLTRIFLLTTLILAFAQPYFPAKDTAAARSEKLIFLDNSYSMQASGKNGPLLKSAIRSIIKNLPEDEEISLITQNKQFSRLSLSEMVNELQHLEYASQTLDFASIKLKAQQIFKSTEGEKDLILISDFQDNLKVNVAENEEDINYHFIPFIPQNIDNISLDSLILKNREANEVTFQVKLSSSTNLNESISVSVYDGEKLLAKSAVNFAENLKVTAEFKISSEEIQRGRISIEDAGLQYDNRLYFSLNKLKPARVIVIKENSEANFVNRILTPPEFDLQPFKISQLDYSELNNADFVILNELETLPGALRSNLQSLKKKGVPLAIVLPIDANIKNYNSLLSSLEAPTISGAKKQEQLITDITYAHPLFNDVFNEQTENFDYPKVQSSYNVIGGNKVISYQDNSGFLVELNENYLFTAAINNENSNFKSSPLIVPIFYKLGLSALKNPKLYYENAEAENIQIPLTTKQDEVVHLVSTEDNFIPQQRILGDNLEINTGSFALPPGNYAVTYQEKNKAYLSFNAPRTESELVYKLPKKNENSNIHSSVEDYFKKIKAAGESTQLWKCFVIFALIFLVTEMLLLKFLK